MFEKKPLEDHLMYLDTEKPGWYRLVCKHEGPREMQIIAWAGTLILPFLGVIGLLTVANV